MNPELPHNAPAAPSDGVADTDRLAAENAELRRRLERIEALLAAPAVVETPDDGPRHARGKGGSAPSAPSRRDLVRVLTAGAAGAVGGAMLAPGSAAAAPTAFQTESVNTASVTTTELRITTAGEGTAQTPPVGLLVNDTTRTVADPAFFPSASAGWGEDRDGINGYSVNQFGVYGESEGLVGVAGFAPDGVGVDGTGLIGVTANALSGGLALALRSTETTANPLTLPRVANAGTLYIENSGGPTPTVATVWLDTGTGGFRRLAGPATAGALAFLPAPVRCYDSRAGQPPLSGTKGQITANNSRAIDVKANSTGVPVGARGVIGNITVANTAGIGNLRAYPDGASTPLVATLNYNGANQIVNNSFSAALGPNESLRIFVTAATDVIVDIVGYYL